MMTIHQNDCFDFLPKSGGLTKEQEKNFFSPEDYNLAEYAWKKIVGNYKALRRGGGGVVRGMTIWIMKSAGKEFTDMPYFFLTGDLNPESFGIAFRYRHDKPWWIVVYPNQYSEFPHPNPAVQLLSQPVHWPVSSITFVEFISELITMTINHRTPSWRPVSRFLSFVQLFLKPNVVEDLAQALMTVDFFPVEIPINHEFTLDVLKTSDNWVDVVNFAHFYDYPTTRGYYAKQENTDNKLDWFTERANDDKTVLIMARSREQGQMPLGYLLGGVDPKAHVPCIYSCAVLPDERRRGVATAMFKKFFAQTGYQNVALCLYMKQPKPPYEAANFLKKWHAERYHAAGNFWYYDLPSLIRSPSKESLIKRIRENLIPLK